MNKRLDPELVGPDAERLETELRKRVVGQDDAVKQICNIYQTNLAGMSSPGRPIGNFLFLGPTGSGKTRLVEALAEGLMGDLRAVIKIDCAEFQHSHEIAKLVGAPPGYLGHRETHPMLSQEAINQYHTEKLKLSFVLFDEIEKASGALWNLLLGILDKATLTLGDNRRVDFSRAMIFMTSNLGAAEMSRLLKPSLGFAAPAEDPADGIDVSLAQKFGTIGIEAARRRFSPEFMNRIDKTVVFQPLGGPELEKILTMELNIVQQRVFNSASGAPFVFRPTYAARQFLLAEGTDIQYGARHLKRAIDRHLVHPLSNLIATDQVKGGDLIEVDYDRQGRKLFFTKEAEDMPAYAMCQLVDTSITPPLAGSAAAAQPNTATAKTTRR